MNEPIPTHALPDAQPRAIPMPMLAALRVYVTQGYSWLLFAVLFFAPDLFILGYLRGKEFGSMVYNLGHTYAVPSLLVGLSLLTGWAGLMPVAIIWLAHIGMDRAVGYCLKYPDSFHNPLICPGCERGVLCRILPKLI